MERASAWISRGFEELVYEAARNAQAAEFDVVIVGSGYGGAMAAAALAGAKTHEGAPISVCVLERGREYLAGMFPGRLADLAGHVRLSTEGSAEPKGRREGLFDFRVGSDVSALLANGLGGGSLINAGVMEKPLASAFEGWPEGLWRELDETWYGRAREALGAEEGNTIARHPCGPVAKHTELGRLAGMPLRDASVTIAMAPRENAAGVQLGGCQLCGDCATGCNREAKDSLDKNLLVQAHRAGAALYTGATVLKIARKEDEGRWTLDVVYTHEKLRRRHGKALELRARYLILAAGTYGSTEILLRSESDSLRFSPRLGSRFSGNGDTIAVVYGRDRRVNAVADETEACESRNVGPTITGVIDLRADPQRRCLIEDLAIPGPLRRAFGETVATSRLLHALSEADRSSHGPDSPGHDPCAVDAKALDNTSIVAMMGDDGAAGLMRLLRDPACEGDGAIRVRWPELRDAEVFGRQLRVLTGLAGASDAKAKVLPNPLFQLLPQSMEFLIDRVRGPAFTVHPLGGCPMGTDARDGVVDDKGRVFRGTSGTQVWPGLAVLDGSIVRSALGTNPALTIAALAMRAVHALRDDEWKLRAPSAPQPKPERRPVFSPPPPPSLARPTRIEIIERMSGEVLLEGRDGKPLRSVVELTLPFQPADLAPLVLPRRRADGGFDGVAMQRQLRAAPGAKLRVFTQDRWQEFRLRRIDEGELLRDGLIAEAKLEGVLHLLHRERSGVVRRFVRGLRAYLCNRGLRDIWQGVFDRKGELNLSQRVVGAFKLATRAGEARLLDYDLTLGAPLPGSRAGLVAEGRFAAGAAVRGRKRLTYGRRSNPWRQLMEMELTAFPAMASAGMRTLELDTRYLAGIGVPLLRIVGQQDQPSALADMASFAAYFARLLLSIHIWSFRRPDAHRDRQVQRLPGVVPGLPPPEIRELEVGRTQSGAPVKIRLTRYRPEKPHSVPVMLVPGYSTSGTTFAHHAVRPNLAEYLCNRNRDVWILDQRTSSGMPTAREPWAFEEAALGDFPPAVEEICREVRCEQLDVFVHCMGSAMFSMAVLADPDPRYPLQQKLAGRIRNAVMSQIGPFVSMSAANTLRGYLMSYVRHFLPLANYEFRVGPDPGLLDQLLDRLLATLPYPEVEFDIENPRRPCKRAEFVGTRRRMDALYGRDFRLADEKGARLDDKVLEHIDDLFGPLSIETVSQAIHFARTESITDRLGNSYPTSDRIKQRWTFRTLSLHADHNGLADVGTRSLLEQKLGSEIGARFQAETLQGFGHQDSLIGRDAARVFARIADFLE